MYLERANSFGKVGGPCKSLTDESRDSPFYFAIKDILRVRAADFVEQTYFCEVCPINILQNVLEDINGDRRHGVFTVAVLSLRDVTKETREG